MGNCCTSQDNTTCEPDIVRQKSNFEQNKDKTFVIIGAGPAGLHMGHLLHSKGYENVIILEKSGESHSNIGKTFTINDKDVNNDINDYGKDKDGNDYNIVHELGTCYLHPEYHVIDKLLKKYDPDNKQIRIPSRAVFFDETDEKKDKDDREYKDGIGFDKWVLSEAEKLAYPKEFHWLPDIITGGAAFVDSMIRYNKLHEEIFGKQECNLKHGFLGKPKNFDKKSKLYDMTFLKFLEKNKFYGLIPTFVYSQSVQGYGTLDSIPAYYGLFWNTPELLKQVTDIIRAIQDEPNVTCLTKGFASLWRNIISQCQLDIQYNTTIKSINRYLSDPDKQMEINYKNSEGSKEVLMCDFIFFACGMHNNVKLLDDATEEEIDVWKCMKSHTLCATLYETDIKEGSKRKGNGKYAAGQIWPNKIWHADGQLYAQRNSLKCLLGPGKYKELVKAGKLKKDRYVGYQFLAKKPESGDGDILLEKFKFGITKTGVSEYNIIKQECWEYFPIWNQTGINKGYPWKVKDEMQGRYKNSFYIGASVCFESVLSVIEYNNELDHKFHF